MKLKDVEQRVRRQPFIAFRIHMSNGKTFVISHPDQVILSEDTVIVGVGGDKERRIVEHIEHCDYLHITHIEQMPRRGHGSKVQRPKSDD
jgi:hypothetical protein